MDDEGNKLHLEKKNKEHLAEPVAVYNFAVEDYHTYFVGENEILVHNICGLQLSNNETKKLALGLSDYLDDFAKANGAETWKNFADPINWKNGVNEALFDPNTRIIFNLNGIDNPMRAVQRAAVGLGGATDWELYMIKQTQSAWDRITWYLNGQVVNNPFTY